LYEIAGDTWDSSNYVISPCKFLIVLFPQIYFSSVLLRKKTFIIIIILRFFILFFKYKINIVNEKDIKIIKLELVYLVDMSWSQLYVQEISTQRWLCPLDELICDPFKI